MKKEIALGDIPTMKLAIASGINRVELNAHLELGGLTPAWHIVAQAVDIAQAAKVELVVMIRPRAGDFNYNYAEIESMRQSILLFKSLGVKMVTFGIVDAKGRLDKQNMIKLLEAAKPMQVVYHMAFDAIDKAYQDQALQWLYQYGVIRILTHGGQLNKKIDETIDHLQEIVSMAPDKLIIMPGGGVTYQNAANIAEKLGVKEVHGSKIIAL
ncbi:copper homeostasis protein CutC [Weissella sagaensis]|uniref:PF03932 family protein CutC n=1 Tax=Weissella sagaensis TaxID=2559928 RepID=A0ABW1RVE4_9LACO|nr:copper homeostasis protein CutC [Weissella sagaensis]MBU7568705.1 copper homeostasis protein CutC [Weissella hellenica]QDJ58983.1 copper homeostasis protein CutC [Weissella hellenica]QEA57981.1 copper homeostasis protein CutC [Weissella hellenica]